MKNIFFLITFFVVCVCIAPKLTLANNYTKPSLNIDTNYFFKERSFDSTNLQNFKNNKEFLYDLPPPKNLIPNSFLEWLIHKIESLLSGLFLKEYSFLFKYIFGIFLLYFVIKQLYNANFTGIFYKQTGKKQKTILYDFETEHIDSINFNDLIKKALENKNFKQAVRLYYLKTLKHLSDKQLINWQLNKTNSDYMVEMKNNPKFLIFKQLTHLFEHVAYGNFLINEYEFLSIENKFIEFNNQV